jgi:glyoxylase I family protein
VTGHRVTHIGLCVHDLARSIPFYEQALGFTQVGRISARGPETDAILGLPGTVVDIVYLERDGWRIELLAYEAGATGDGAPRSMDRVGFTHLSIRVASVDDLIEPIEAHGGSVIADSMVTFEWGNRGVMAVDPDGIRIELIEERPT